MAKKRKPKTIMEQLRAAIDDAPVSRYRIAKETGIAESQISRFMSGESGISAETIDRIGEYLELDLVSRKAERK